MNPQPQSAAVQPQPLQSEEGYVLLGLIVAIALLLLALSVAAANEAFAIRRDREVETARRADQYVRAIRLYFKKFGHYPGSVEQLENSNNIRFLRRRWIDPLTGSTDWRTIAVGQNQTTAKGFFGEPLTGLATTGAGSPAGSQGPGAAAQGAAAAAGAPGGSAAAGAGTLGLGIVNPISTVGAGAGANGATAGTPGAPGGLTSGPGGTGGATGAFMGVGTNATGNSILEINEQTTYQTWEFLYDPRVEQLKLKQQLNSGMQTNSAGSFGQSPAGQTPNGQLPSGTAPPGPRPAPVPGGDTPNQP